MVLSKKVLPSLIEAGEPSDDLTLSLLGLLRSVSWIWRDRKMYRNVSSVTGWLKRKPMLMHNANLFRLL